MTDDLPVRTSKQRTCEHRELAFGSGDYYIFCHACGARWGHLSNDSNVREYEYGPDGKIRVGCDSYDCNTSLSGQKRLAVETPEKPVAWYRWGGSALRPIIMWGDWPPPEPDDVAWYPLYSSPEGRPAVKAPERCPNPVNGPADSGKP